MNQDKILIYDPKCPKCRFIGKLLNIFDVKGKISYIPLRSPKAINLLHEFYPIIPWNFHYVINSKDLCFTGIKAIPMILYEIIIGLIWPYNGDGPAFLKSR